MRELVRDRLEQQTASRMKEDGIPVRQIARYTGISIEEIEDI